MVLFYAQPVLATLTRAFSQNVSLDLPNRVWRLAYDGFQNVVFQHQHPLRWLPWSSLCLRHGCTLAPMTPWRFLAPAALTPATPTVISTVVSHRTSIPPHALGYLNIDTKGYQIAWAPHLLPLHPKRRTDVTRPHYKCGRMSSRWSPSSVSLESTGMWYYYHTRCYRSYCSWVLKIYILPLFQNKRCFSFCEANVSRHILVCRLGVNL